MEMLGGLAGHLNRESLYVAIGILGATVMPHNLYLHSALVQTRHISRDESAKRTACRFNLIDSVVALNFALLVNAAILVLAAAVFFKRGVVVTEIQQAYVLLTPLLGTGMASIMFAVALLCSGQSSTLTVTAANATSVVITDNLDSTKYALANTGGTVTLSPTATTIYTVTATGTNSQTATAMVTVTVSASAAETSINHVVFMLQENRTFDTYFGMLNPYRKTNGWAIGDDGKEYDVDGIDDKLTKLTNVNDEGTVFGPFKFATACIDDLSSDWLASYGDVSRYNFTTTRKILMDGFVHTAENYAKSCQGGKCGSGNLTDDLIGNHARSLFITRELH